MIRLLIALLALTAVAALMVGLSSIDGRTIMDLGPWQIRLDTGVLLIAALVAVVVLTILNWMIIWILRGTSYALQSRRERKQIKILRGIARGFALLAADMPHAALKHVSDTKSAHADTILAQLLSAVVTDNEQMRTVLEQTLDDRDLKPLALKSLLKLESVRSNPKDYKAVLSAITETAEAAEWSRAERYQNALSEQRWADAASLVVGNGRAKQEERNKLLLTGARTALERGNISGALELTAKALKNIPHWPPAVALSIKALVAENKYRKALVLLKTTWAKQSHPDLVQAFALITAKDKPDDMLKKAQALVGNEPEGYPARLLWAEALLRVGRNTEVHLALDRLCNDYPTLPVYRLVARVAEQASPEQVTHWLRLAVNKESSDLWDRPLPHQ